MRDDDWLWVGGAVILLAMTKQEIDWGTGWVYPMPILRTPSGDLIPEVSQEFRSTNRPHLGVDVMYRNVNGKRWDVPVGVAVLAAKDGRLWSVSRAPRGWTVVLDHGPPWSTFYTHLDSVDPSVLHGTMGVSRKGDPMVIEAGRVLGTVGYDPLDSQKVRHLHFATWYRGSGDRASVDPRGAMGSWKKEVVEWTA